MEGTRPLLIEVQALVSPSPLGTPRRTTVGWDLNRLAMILAVLEARAGVQIGQNDVYLNVAGGLKAREPAADLAVAAALLSSLTGTVIPPGMGVGFGEIALSGSVARWAKPQGALRKPKSWGSRKRRSPPPPEQPGLKGLAVRPMETIMTWWPGRPPRTADNGELLKSNPAFDGIGKPGIRSPTRL